jgi:hypothetical protein
MIQIDGKTVDLTNPQTWGNSIEIKPNGFIEQTKDGVTTHIENQQTIVESLTTLENK